MTVFVQRGEEVAFHRNLTRSLTCYLPDDTREELRELIEKHEPPKADKLEAIIHQSHVSVWATKSGNKHQKNALKQFVLYRTNITEAAGRRQINNEYIY